MKPKFPIWINIVFGLQILAAIALAVFLWILGSAYNDSWGVLKIMLLLIVPLTPILCWWLARGQWQAERYAYAKLLTFGPIIAFCLLEVFAGIVMMR